MINENKRERHERLEVKNEPPALFGFYLQQNTLFRITTPSTCKKWNFMEFFMEERCGVVAGKMNSSS
jgi:hypothetical protein